MDTMRLVDPELRPLLEAFPALNLSMESLQETRERVFPMPEPDVSKTTQERTTVPGPAGAPDVDVLVYRPKAFSGPLPCIYHIHGGGYVLGKAQNQEPVHRQVAGGLGCAIVSVEYRLAPETPFPGPIEDCYAGLAWTFAQAAELGLDASRIGVMGESAGGGLAAALALLARDRGEYALAFQHLIYPMLDDRTCEHADPHPHAGEFIWHALNNRFGWSSLLGHEPGRDGVSPYAAPARAEDLSRLPPTFISTGALDLFLEEDLEYARRLLRAGVPTELHVYPGAFHAFDMAPDAGVAQQARRDSREALAGFMRR
ncbi:MAG TPA: alpha/beta hydrolase [Caulobacteraceae bacterium]|jgi:triacylglycerol lipase